MGKVSFRPVLQRFGSRNNHVPRGRSSRRNSESSLNNEQQQRTSPRNHFWPLHRLNAREPQADPFVTRDPYSFRGGRLPTFLRTEHKQNIHAFVRERIPGHLRELLIQLYRHLLLRLPSLYFTRVSRIFEEAQVSRPEMERMILGCARGVDFPNDWSPPTVSPALSRFKHNWENFIDQVIKEWKTLNIVSALLLS